MIPGNTSRGDGSGIGAIHRRLCCINSHVDILDLCRFFEVKQCKQPFIKNARPTIGGNGPNVGVEESDMLLKILSMRLLSSEPGSAPQRWQRVHSPGVEKDDA